MEHDYMKRGYLLPEGCKDLGDVLKRKQERPQDLLQKLPQQFAQLPKGHGTMLKPLPPIKGELVLPPQTSVAQLAALLNQKPFRIVADLMEIGVFANANQVMGFGAISRVARKYGLIAKKAA